jgi:hypothetical protein
MGRRKRATEQQQDVPAVRLLTKQNQLQQHQKPKSTTDSPPLDSLPAPPRIVKPLALETTPPVEESAAITPVQVFREIAGHLIPSVRMQSPIPLFTAGDGSIWDLNPAVADYLSSDPSISYNVIGIVATDRRMSINDLISCLLADDDGFSAAAAADFTTKWTADSKSSSAFNLWITRNRLIIIECTATLRDAPSFQVM